MVSFDSVKINNFSPLSLIFLSSKTSRRRLSLVSISCFSAALANLTKNFKLVISNFNSSKDSAEVNLASNSSS
jgi:hypothetical protein